MSCGNLMHNVRELIVRELNFDDSTGKYFVIEHHSKNTTMIMRKLNSQRKKLLILQRIGSLFHLG